MMLVIRQFYTSMRRCVRLDDGVCLRWFAVEQRLHQGCVLASSLFSIFFGAFIDVAYKRFKADKDMMDALVYLTQKETGGGGEQQSES